MLGLRMVADVCQIIEFTFRFFLCNIPLFIIAKFPEIDWLFSIIMAYLLMTIVGFCWAILVNASFSIAVRSTEFLPPIYLFEYILNYGQPAAIDNDSFKIDSIADFSSIQIMSVFYVSYASIRIFIGFAKSIFFIGLQSIRDFPNAAKILSLDSSRTLRLVPMMFIPTFFLEVALLLADFSCTSDSNDIQLPILKYRIPSVDICKQGLVYLSSSYPHIRKVFIYSLIVTVLQLWQCLLHQIPRWDRVFKRLNIISRIFFQVGVVLLSVLTLGVIFPPATFADKYSSDHWICLILSGWTLWLLAFYPYLLETYGSSWINQVSQKSIVQLAGYIRTSQILIYAIIYLRSCYYDGLIRAQLDLTFITVIVPTLYSSIYLLIQITLKSNATSLLYCIPIVLVMSVVVTQYFAHNYGKGSVILVFFHMLGKILCFFGEDTSSVEVNQENVYMITAVDDLDLLEDDYCFGNECTVTDVPVEPVERIVSNINESSELQPIIRSSSIAITKSLSVSTSIENLTRSSRVVSDAELVLSQRGKENSSLVTLGIPEAVHQHWLVQLSKRNILYFSNFVRSFTVHDNVYISGIVLSFISFGAIWTLLLSVISVASFLQNTLNLFPKTMNFHITNEGNILFDHHISNVTLFVNKLNPAFNNISNIPQITREIPSVKLEYPQYASCNWKAYGLSLLDFALLSELAYFQVSSMNEKLRFRELLDIIFPSYNFEIISNNVDYQGPAYLEFRSNILNTTVISIRGTDVGRLHDFLEDVKLYAEPVIFNLLSIIFPTIRMWTHDTMRTVIEWLFEFNSFFGLQGEAEYYRSLVTRVQELQLQGNTQIVITGHSLGMLIIVITFYALVFLLCRWRLVSNSWYFDKSNFSELFTPRIRIELSKVFSV